MAETELKSKRGVATFNNTPELKDRIYNLFIDFCQKNTAYHPEVTDFDHVDAVKLVEDMIEAAEFDYKSDLVNE